MLTEETTHWGLIFSALTYAIKTNSGIGFHNSDQGHPAYMMGAKDGTFDYEAYGDSPDHNGLFKMMFELSKEYGGDRGPKIETWQQFCKLAYDSNCSAKGAGK